jgi:four helix bundle protein
VLGSWCWVLVRGAGCGALQALPAAFPAGVALSAYSPARCAESGGTRRASILATARPVGVRHHEELRAWQQCHAVRERLRAITARREWQADLDLRSQIRRAIRSACGNVAEGFWRYGHREFAHYVTIARGSLGELQSHLTEAASDGLLTAEEHRILGIETKRALESLTGLLKYLRQTRTPPPPRGRKNDQDLIRDPEVG